MISVVTICRHSNGFVCRFVNMVFSPQILPQIGRVHHTFVAMRNVSQFLTEHRHGQTLKLECDAGFLLIAF